MTLSNWGRGGGTKEYDGVARLLLMLLDKVKKEKDELRDPKASGPRGGASGGFVQRMMWSELHLVKNTLLLCSEGTVGNQIGASGISEDRGGHQVPGGRDVGILGPSRRER